MYNPQSLAVYIHWPFCKSKCPYCDFYKKIARQVDQQRLVDSYLDSLAYYQKLTAERVVQSVFFGGGTPSLMEPRQIERLLDFIAKNWKMAENAEISLEANPNSDRPSLFSELKQAGINRLSLGVQALNDVDLRFLGRTHDVSAARHCLEKVVQVFNNHSADLIYALPRQTFDNWRPTLEEICSYGLKHLSLYQLTIEEGTVFARKNIQAQGEDEAVSLYQQTRCFLHEKGYEMYEVSNFCQQGYASRHNLAYWQGDDYLGIGESAHGRLYLNGAHYATVYPLCHEALSFQERAEELIIMGLRLRSGVSKKHFAEVCGFDFHEFVNPDGWRQLRELHLIDENEAFVFATEEGFLLLDKLVELLCC